MTIGGSNLRNVVLQVLVWLNLMKTISFLRMYLQRMMRLAVLCRSTVIIWCGEVLLALLLVLCARILQQVRCIECSGL